MMCRGMVEGVPTNDVMDMLRCCAALSGRDTNPRYCWN